MLTAKTWNVLFDLPELRTDGHWCRTVFMLALKRHAQHTAELDPEEAKKIGEPDASDPEETIGSVLNGNAPEWWPKDLGRLVIKVVATPDRANPDHFTAPPFSISESPDLGLRIFKGHLIHFGSMLGTSWTGSWEIRVLAADTKEAVGGMTLHDIRIGDKPRGAGHGAGYASPEAEYWRDVADKHGDQMMKMYQGSASVIHASAAVIQATRGVNPLPPWMQDNGASPWWQSLAETAVKVAGSAMLGLPMDGMGEEVGKSMGKMIQQQGARTPGGITQADPRLQITDTQRTIIDPQGPPQESGDYDGFIVQEDDQVDWDTGLEESQDEEEEEETDDETDNKGESVDETDDEEAQDDNPLAGMSPEKVAELMEKYIDTQPDKKKIAKLGTRLARKLMSG